VRRYLLIMMGILVAAGCATSRDTKQPAQAVPPSDVNSPGDAVFDDLDAELSQKQVSVPDPLEPVNRAMYGVNDALFVWLKPVVQFYIDGVPKPVRTGMRNFFRNLTTPARLANCLLQGKPSAAATEVNRFAINTTVGVAGIGDPARDRWGLKSTEEDLGQTLAVYGLGDGCYLVWPLFGPSTLRDSVGITVDQFLNPIQYVKPKAASIGLYATDSFNGMSFYFGDYESLKAATLDPYIAMRQAYIQYRAQQVRDAALPPSEPNDPNR
jgi:phospholipid-binding lipoprotein MlaA